MDGDLDGMWEAMGLINIVLKTDLLDWGHCCDVSWCIKEGKGCHRRFCWVNKCRIIETNL